MPRAGRPNWPFTRSRVSFDAISSIVFVLIPPAVQLAALDEHLRTLQVVVGRGHRAAGAQAGIRRTRRLQAARVGDL